MISVASCVIALFLAKAIEQLRSLRSHVQTSLLSIRNSPNFNQLIHMLQDAHLGLLASVLEKEKALEAVSRKEHKLVECIMAHTSYDS